MRIIIACEFSQIVTKAFREKGHEAYSCDILPCEGGHPEWHFQGDILNYLDEGGWDLLIAHPPCTYINIAANRWYKDQPARGRGVLVGESRRQARKAAVEFFLKLWNCNIPKIAIENPVGIMSTLLRRPDQVIQPWQHGHGETKATCLWLKNLPLLQPTKIVTGREGRIWKMPPSPERSKKRSLTYDGIAAAMGLQWGCVA